MAGAWGDDEVFKPLIVMVEPKPPKFATTLDEVLALRSQVAKLRAALKPFADQVLINTPGHFTVKSDRERLPVTDMIRAKMAFDSAAQ